MTEPRWRARMNFASFSQAMLNDPHLGNTLEVFDLGSRPAACCRRMAVGAPRYRIGRRLTAAPGFAIVC